MAEGGSWHPSLFSLASPALLIKEVDLGMIIGANLAEMLGGGSRRTVSDKIKGKTPLSHCAYVIGRDSL